MHDLLGFSSTSVHVIKLASEFFFLPPVRLTDPEMYTWNMFGAQITNVALTDPSNYKLFSF